MISGRISRMLEGRALRLFGQAHRFHAVLLTWQ